MLFGEYELSPGLIGLSLLPQLIRKLFNAYRFGPPYRVTGTSSWSSVDHLVSRLPPATIRPLQARFHCGSGAERLNLAADGNS